MSDRNYGALRNTDDIARLFDRMIASGKPFGFDIEAGYVGPDASDIAKQQFHPTYIFVGVSFTISTDWARYVPVAHDDGNNVDDPRRFAKLLWRLLTTGRGVAHNVSYELKGLSRWFREMLWNDPEVGQEVRDSLGLFPFLADTMLLVWLSAEYEPKVAGTTRKDLKSITYEAFGLKMTNFKDLFPKEDSDMGPGRGRVAENKIRFNTRYSTSERVVAYACEDSVATLMLYEKYAYLLEEFITGVEHQLVPVLIRMEMGPVDPETGQALGNMFFDWAFVAKKEAEVLRFRDKFGEELVGKFGERVGNPALNLNLGSSMQMKKIIYDPAPHGLGLPINDRFRSKTTNEPSTGDDAMKVIAKSDPLIRDLLTYRQIAKVSSGYLTKFLTDNAYTPSGYVFPNHNQAGALTGRMSVDHVSYQQWPKAYEFKMDDGTRFDMNFRDIFIAPDGWRIMGFDYSQVELRVLASVAQETAMIQAFSSGIDIHKATAAKMFKIPLDQVTKKDRGKGKTINFAIVYGQGADALGEGITAGGDPTTTEQAEELLEMYFAGFPKLRNWMDARIAEGSAQGFVRTPFGRKFTVWEYRDRRNFIRKKGDRMCVNAPIQGGAADYMKIALVRADKAIRKAGMQDKIRMTLNIHDALELLVHKSVSDQEVIDLLNGAVSFPVNIFPIEIRADWHVGIQWGHVVEIKLKDGKIHHYEIEDHNEEFLTAEAAYECFAELDAKKLHPDLPNTPVGAGEAPEVQNSADEDLPPWAASAEFMESQKPQPARTAVIRLTEMMSKVQYEDFEDWMSHRPGDIKVRLETPEGDITLDRTIDVTDADKGMVAFLLGAADMHIVLDEADADLIAEGIEF